jgi:hypothetical protein
MRRAYFKLAMGALFAISAFAMAADEKKAAPKPVEPTAGDWSKYVTVSEVQGEIVKIEKNGFLLKIPGPLQNKTTGTGRNRRTTLVPGKPVEISVAFADGALVRWNKLPPKTDKDGKKLAHTADEIQELKKPYGVTGYAAERSDLKAGQYVDLIMVRSRDIPAAKATDADLLIKRATITGDDPTVKTAEDPKKKKQ